MFCLDGVSLCINVTEIKPHFGDFSAVGAKEQKFNKTQKYFGGRSPPKYFWVYKDHFFLGVP
jgi:hypothetical protein